MKKLLVNAIVITMDSQRRILPHGAVCYQGNRILEVGDSEVLRQRYPEAEQLDCEGNLLLPGFIEPVVRLGSGLLGKQYSDDGQRWEAMLDQFGQDAMPAELAADSMLLAQKALNVGVTTLGVCYPDGLLAHVAAKHHAGLASTGLQAITVRQLVRLDSAGAKQEDMLLVDNPLDQADAKSIQAFFEGETRRMLIPLTPQRLDNCCVSLLSLLNQRSIALGCHGLRFPHLRQLAQQGVSVIYTPKTNLPSAHVVEMLHQGIAVALSGFGDARSPLDPMLIARRAQLFDITCYDDYHILPYAKTLEMITCEAAEVMGLTKECGSLEAGKRADINLLDWKQPHLTPNFMPLQGCMGRANGRDITMVIANGRTVKAHGQIVEELSPSVLKTIHSGGSRK